MIEKLSLYRSFSAVARCGSISAAAKELFVSQPAVSADISELEKKLGVRLFFRTNRGVTLTGEGELLLEYVGQALRFLDAGEDALRELGGLQQGHLCIGASDMTLRFYLLDYIARFCRQYPAIRLSVTNHPSPQTVEALRNGKIDFGVVSEPLAGNTDDLVLIPVRQIQDLFVCSPDRPIVKEMPVSPERLRREQLMMLERETSTRRFLRIQPAYAELEAEIELATSDLLIEAACRGIGVATVVEDFALPALAQGKLCRLTLTEPLPHRHLLLAYLKKAPLSAAARHIISMMTQGLDEAEAQKVSLEDLPKPTNP